ncbi:hypothetical protein CLOM_g17443 [Closterium sp. NIES-68]|nr:hypothetical protein CLOM_g17443 [Closterium sp. NIES-68]GJP57887.1 hypothetical protein CLOP_g17929 [Closterium sp. NIES-67]
MATATVGCRLGWFPKQLPKPSASAHNPVLLSKPRIRSSNLSAVCKNGKIKELVPRRLYNADTRTRTKLSTKCNALSDNPGSPDAPTSLPQIGELELPPPPASSSSSPDPSADAPSATSDSASPADSEAGSVLGSVLDSDPSLRRSVQVTFTCGVCGARTSRLVNPLALKKGTVFVQCGGCEKFHRLVDNLGLIVEYDFRNESESESGSERG